MAFTHLHVHTEYSPKDSIAKIERIAKKVAEDQQQALAITDHGSLGGMWELRTQALAHNLKPIPGFEAYLALDPLIQMDDGRTRRAIRTDHATIEVPKEGAATDGDGSDGATKKVRYHHLTVLASSQAGWRNLVRLHNEAWLDTWHGAPRIDYDMLREYRDGLIVLTGCLGGPLQRPLQSAVMALRRLNALTAKGALSTTEESLAREYTHQVETSKSEARRGLERLIDIFGAKRVFIEVMDHGIDGEEEIIPMLYSLGDELGVKCVASGDSHCVDAHEEPAQDAWLAIGSKKKYADPNRWRFSGSGYHVKTEAEMRATRPDDPRWQEACDNTQIVADLVEDDVLPEPKLRLPKFPGSSRTRV